MKKLNFLTVFSTLLILSIFCARNSFGQEQEAKKEADKDGVISALQEKVRVLEAARADNRAEIERLTRANKQLLKRGALSPAPAEKPVTPKRDEEVAVKEAPKDIETKERSFAEKDVFVEAKAAFLRGEEYANNKDFEGAKAEFEAAIDINPNMVASRVRLAECYKELKEYDKAIVQYKTLITQMPYAIESYISMADIYLEKRDVENAVKVLDDGIILNPTGASLHESRGIIYYNEGQSDKAKEEFLKELKLNPGAKESRAHLKLIEKEEKAKRNKR